MASWGWGSPKGYPWVELLSLMAPGLPVSSAGVLCGDVGQHLLHQPDVRPGRPVGRRAACHPGCCQPDPDSCAGV